LLLQSAFPGLPGKETATRATVKLASTARTLAARMRCLDPPDK